MINYRDTLAMPQVVKNFFDNWDQGRKDEFSAKLSGLYEYIQDYMGKWTKWTEPLSKFEWANLDEPLDVESVVASPSSFSRMGISVEIDNDALKDEIATANEIILDKALDWISLSTSEKWVELLQEDSFEELLKIAEVLICFPGTNAVCERFFSEVVYFWNKWRGSMTLATVKSIMSIRFNLERDCNNVLSMLTTDQSLREAIRGNDKYERAKLSVEKELASTLEQLLQDSSDDDDEEDEDEEPLYKLFCSMVLSGKIRSKFFTDDDDDYVEIEKDDVPMRDCSDIHDSELDDIRKDAAAMEVDANSDSSSQLDDPFPQILPSSSTQVSTTTASSEPQAQDQSSNQNQRKSHVDFEHDYY